MDKGNNISDDPEKSLPPELSKTPFRTGNDYFEDFSARLNERIEGLEEIRSIAPVLFAIPKYNPFEVPDGYFEELPSFVSEKVIHTRRSASVTDWIMMIIRPRFVIPVAVTLFFAFAGINYMNRTADVQPVQTGELSLEEHLYDIDEAAIVDALTADASPDIENSDENSIQDYLLDNNIDESTLEL